MKQKTKDKKVSDKNDYMDDFLQEQQDLENQYYSKDMLKYLRSMKKSISSKDTPEYI